jgi:hypothetical protein
MRVELDSSLDSVTMALFRFMAMPNETYRDEALERFGSVSSGLTYDNEEKSTR